MSMPVSERRRGAVPRPPASPLPLGLAGLTIASLLVSGLDLGWIPLAQSHQVGMLLLVAVVPLQSLAGVFAVVEGDGAAATAMGVLAVTWGATGLTKLTSLPGATSHVLALELFAGGALLLAAAVAQIRDMPPVALVLGLAAVRFAFTGLFELTAATSWQDVGGWVGIAVVALALCLVWGLVIADARKDP